MPAILIGWTLLFSSSAPPPCDEEIAAAAKTEFDAGLRHKHRFFEARKHYQSAADAYLLLHERGVRNVELYRGLGNALTLADRWPDALWACQMGLALAPGDAMMHEHLADLRARVLLPPDGQGRAPPDRSPVWLPRLTVRASWWIAVFAYYFVCCTIASCFLFRSRLSIGFGATALIVAILASVSLWFALDRQRMDRETPLCVLIDNTPFRTGNGNAYPQHQSVPVLPRGIESRVLHRRGEWLQVALSTGEIGWVPNASVRVVRLESK